MFNTKKYTEAFTIYQSLDEQGVATSSMYLKMAYIKEALEDIPGALYYLNKYYLRSRNKIALKKMENLAEEHKLDGYEYSDKEFLENLVIKYGAAISMVLVLALLFLFGFMAVKIYRKKTQGLAVPVLILVLTLVVLINSNIRLDKTYAIVKSDNSFIMSHPSSGSDVLEYIEAGNRFIVTNDNGIWLKLRLSGKIGYVRKIDMNTIAEKQPVLLWLFDRINFGKA